MFYLICLLPEVKCYRIIALKQLIYELPQELLSHLRLKILGNEEIQANFVNYENEKFVSACKSFLKNRN